MQAPAVVFVDEIDAIAGRHARKDPRRRATFEALIAQLDGELVSSLCHNYIASAYLSIDLAGLSF